ncbi:MAG: PEP-utilizing enzyme [Solirubrobacteraceae bacterium]
MMSHAAILCREYRIPAVLGTGSGTRRIRTGDLVSVDGDGGTVRILRRAA